MIKKIIYFFKKIFCRKALRRDAIDKMIEEQEEKTSDKSPSDIEKKEEKEKEPTEEKLYTKVSDIILAKAFYELGLKAEVLTER